MTLLRRRQGLDWRHTLRQGASALRRTARQHGHELALPAVVRDGDQRYGFRIEGEELAAGSYRSMPFNLGTAVGVIPCGKGKIIFSTLDIADNLDNPSGPAEVARKLLCNYIKYSQAK